MKEKKLHILVIVMASALLLLTGIQIYWTISAVNIEEERFKSSVNAALNDAVLKLEKRETAEIVVHKLRKGRQNFIGVSSDSEQTEERIIITQTLPVSDTNSNNRSLIWNTDSLIELYDLDTSGNGGTSFSYAYKFKTTEEDSGGNMIISVTEGNDSINQFQVIADLDSVRYYKQLLVEGVVDEMIDFKDQPIDERIPKEKIDTLLAQMFDNRGIHTGFVFAVKGGETGNWFYINEGESDDFTSGTFSVRLFPKDIFGTVYFLYVSFPNQSSYILGEAAVMLVLSALLIVLITGIFYTTVRMFLKQKKITELKNDLINNVSHEFKTPIASISLACDVLAQSDNAQSPDFALRYTKVIKDENERLRLLVENLLHTAAMEKEQIILNRVEVDVHQTLGKIKEQFGVHIDKLKASVSFSLKAENSVIEADPVHLMNILGNLFDNALKYGGEKPEIRIVTDNNDEGVFVSVKDNGIGIETAYKDKIFDTFFRVPTGNIHNVKGNGIGLSYVKKMTEAHGGRVSFKSTAGKGSIFTVFFPFQWKEEDEQ